MEHDMEVVLCGGYGRTGQVIVRKFLVMRGFPAIQGNHKTPGKAMLPPKLACSPCSSLKTFLSPKARS